MTGVKHSAFARRTCPPRGRPRRRLPDCCCFGVAVLGGEVEVIAVPVPIDCTDGFGEAYYARPEAFLDDEVRAAQSGWVLTDDGGAVARGVARLADDLAAGRWDERHGHLRNQAERVGAVRLIVAR